MATTTPYTGDLAAGIDFARPDDFGASVIVEQPTGRIVEMSAGPAIQNVPVVDERAEAIKKLEDEITLSQFRAVLQDPNARRHADRVLRNLQKGTLSFGDFKALPDYMQRAYAAYYPAPRDPALVRREEQARAKRKTKNKMQKASRRRNRK